MHGKNIASGKDSVWQSCLPGPCLVQWRPESVVSVQVCYVKNAGWRTAGGQAGAARRACPVGDRHVDARVAAPPPPGGRSPADLRSARGRGLLEALESDPARHTWDDHATARHVLPRHEREEHQRPLDGGPPPGGRKAPPHACLPACPAQVPPAGPARRAIAWDPAGRGPARASERYFYGPPARRADARQAVRSVRRRRKDRPAGVDVPLLQRNGRADKGRRGVHQVARVPVRPVRPPPLPAVRKGLPPRHAEPPKDTCRAGLAPGAPTTRGAARSSCRARPIRTCSKSKCPTACTTGARS